MYIVDFTIARILMEAKLLEAEASRRARQDLPAGSSYRSNPSWPFTTVFRPAPHPPKGGF